MNQRSYQEIQDKLGGIIDYVKSLSDELKQEYPQFEQDAGARQEVVANIAPINPVIATTESESGLSGMGRPVKNQLTPTEWLELLTDESSYVRISMRTGMNEAALKRLKHRAVRGDAIRSKYAKEIFRSLKDGHTAEEIQDKLGVPLATVLQAENLFHANTLLMRRGGQSLPLPGINT